MESACKQRNQLAQYKVSFFKEYEELVDAEAPKEHVSLENAYVKFIKAPHVLAYFSLVPLVGEVLEKVKPHCMGKEMGKIFDALLRETSPSSLSNHANIKRTLKEVNRLLDELQGRLLTFIDIQLDSQDHESEHKLVHKVVLNYWAAQREEYLARESGLVRLTQTYVAQTLLGFNLGEKGGVYEDRWAAAVWVYLSERDEFNMRVIEALESTQAELEALYLNIKNVVTFKSLVILTLWRLHHSEEMATEEGGLFSLVEILHESGEGEEDFEWTLAYGSFSRDYAVFLDWHQNSNEGRSIHINLFYIDFDASPFTEAIALDMLGHRRRQKKDNTATSFAGVFVNHTKPLALSYMVSAAHADKTIIIVENEDGEAIEIVKTSKSHNNTGGGLRSYFLQ